MFNPSSPLGAASPSLSGFTTPTYTLTESSSPSPYGKAWDVTATGGTQPSGVHTHSVRNPFKLTFYRPSTLKRAGYTINSANNTVTGNIPVNKYRLVTQVGAPLSSSGNTGVTAPAHIELVVSVPAGAEEFGIDAICSGLLATVFATVNQLSGIKDTVVTGSA